MAEIDSVVIINHYKSLDRNGRIAFRKKVTELTGMAESTFYGKLRQFPFTRAEINCIATLLPSSEDAPES